MNDLSAETMRLTESVRIRDEEIVRLRAKVERMERLVRRLEHNEDFDIEAALAALDAGGVE